MSARRIGCLASLWLAGATVLAAGGEGELKQARASFLKAAASGTEDGLEAASARLARAEIPRGALALVELGLERGERRIALVAQRELARTTDARIGRALAARSRELREPRARRLLAEAFAHIPGEDVTRALLRGLGDPDPSVRESSCTSLGEREASTAETVSGSLNQLAHSDASLRVRSAANGALRKLGLLSLPGLESDDFSPLGLPIRRPLCSRVAFVVDASARSCESSYISPVGSGARGPTPLPSPVPTVPGVRAKVAPPAAVLRGPTSCYGTVGEALAASLARLTDEQSFKLGVFASSARWFEPTYVNARGHEPARAAAWLADPVSVQDDRDPGRALRPLLSDEPLPDEIFLFLAGPPAGREADSMDSLERLADRAWDAGVRVNVTLFELAESRSDGELNEVERLVRARELQEARSVAEKLASITRGRFTRVSLPRFQDGVAAVTTGDARAAAADPRVKSGAGREEVASVATDAPLIRLVSGRVPFQELTSLRRVVDSGLKGDPTSAFLKLAAALAACRDPQATDLALRVLLQGNDEARRAVLEALGTNAESRVHARVAESLRTQTDPVKAALLARALGVCPGPAAARCLVAEADAREGSGDVPRILFSALARRSLDELAPIASDLWRAARRPREGLTGVWAKRALAVAGGAREAPAPMPVDRLLPERWFARGVAFVVDGDADIDAPFAVLKGGAPQPVVADQSFSRRDVMIAEIGRALDTLRAGHASCNLLVLGDGGVRWRDQAVPLAEPSVKDAKEFLATRLQCVTREVVAPLSKALADPSVEEIWVLATGLPGRSDADRDPEAVRRRLEGLALIRGVSINVVLPLGAVDAQGSSGPDLGVARAARRDLTVQLTRFWRPLAEATGGEIFVREMLPASARGPTTFTPARKRP